MKPKERMAAVFDGDKPDQVPTGELGVDYPITEHVLGRSTYYRAKYREKSAMWAGKRDEVVASQQRDLVALAERLEWDFVPVFLTYPAHRDHAPSEFVDDATWKEGVGSKVALLGAVEGSYLINNQPDEIRQLVCEQTCPQSLLVKLVTGYTSVRWMAGLGTAHIEPGLWPILQALFPKGAPTSGTPA